MDKKKVKELIEQIQQYCDQAYNPNWQPKSFEEFIKLGNICREAIKELSKSDWVSVEDELPPYGESVLMTDENGFLCTVPLNITHRKPIEKLEE